MPLNIDWQQILLHLLNFTVLFAILYFLLYKPVKKFMEQRTEYYKKLDDEAKAKLADAENTKKEYQSRLEHADAEIAEKKQAAHAAAEAAGAESLRRAEDAAEKLLSDARDRIAAEHTKMLRDAEREITDMVADAAEKLVMQSTTAEAFDQFLDAAGSEGDSDA